MSATQKSRATGETMLLWNRDIGRQIGPLAQFMRDNCAHLRVIDHRRRRVTGEQMIGRLAMIRNLTHQAADHRHFIKRLGSARKILAQVIAGIGPGDAKLPTNFHGCLRFRVERLLLLHAAP